MLKREIEAEVARLGKVVEDLERRLQEMHSSISRLRMQGNEHAEILSRREPDNGGDWVSWDEANAWESEEF